MQTTWKFIILLMIVSLNLKAQEKKFDASKMIYGADIAFSLSDSYWGFGLAPQVGYKFLPKLHAGAGISYMYETSKSSSFLDYKRHSYGVNLFAYYYPWKKIVTKLRPDLTWTKENSELNLDGGDYKYKDTHWTPSVVIGAGLHLKPVMIMLNYDLVQNDHSSLSNNLFLSLGFMF